MPRIATKTACGLLALLLISLAGCKSGGEKPAGPDPTPVSSWYKPASLTSWQWQLSGVLNRDYPVDVYDIDLFDTDAAEIATLQATGKKVICYFSAGSYENWRPDAADFSEAVLGNPLDGWPGERWLDIRASAVRQIMQARLDLARDKGCDGVEPDNVDAYTNRPGFPLNAADQLDYNRFLAREVHARQLAVGLKNDLDQVDSLVDDFDFAINEQCFEYQECGALKPFVDADKAIFNAEYADRYVNDPGIRASLCADAVNAGISTLVMPLALDDGFRYSCL